MGKVTLGMVLMYNKYGQHEMLLKTKCVRPIEIIDIECGLLYRVSQKIVATKWWIYKGKISSPQDILCKSNRFFSRKSQMADL